MTKKSLRDLVNLGVATDITNAEFETLPHLDCVETTHGMYGMNGGLFKDDTGKLYVVLSRNSLLFQLV